MTFEAINWNKVEDDKDLEVWDRLTGTGLSFSAAKDSTAARRW